MLHRAVMAAFVVLFVGLLFANLARIRAVPGGGNYSALLHISTRWFDSNPMMRGRPGVRESLVLEDSGGYDGQFAYFAVFDPFISRYAHAPDNYDHMMDAAPYRFGRIGHAWLTRLIARDHWRRYPETLVWSVVAGCALTALALALVALHHGKSPAWGLMAAVIPGFWQSVQVGLSEPLAAAALVGGYWAWLKHRWWLATGLFACSLLARETGVILVACLAVATWRSGRRYAVLLILGAVLPLVLWKIHVANVLYPEWGTEALLYNPKNLGLPLAGMAAMWSRIGNGAYFPEASAVARAGIAFSILTICASAAAFTLTWRARTAIAFAATCYALVALSMNFSAIWAHVGNAQRGTYELFLCLSIASIGNLSGRAARAVAGVTIGAGALYLIFFAHDASAVRQAIGL